MPTTTCPGCDRQISLSYEELTIPIQCIRCDTQFVPLTGEVIEPRPLGSTADGGTEHYPQRRFDDHEPGGHRDGIGWLVGAGGHRDGIGWLVGAWIFASCVFALVGYGGIAAAQVSRIKAEGERSLALWTRDYTGEALARSYEKEGNFDLLAAVLYIVTTFLMLLGVVIGGRGRQLGNDKIAGWMVIIIFFNVLGLAIYLMCRPTLHANS